MVSTTSGLASGIAISSLVTAPSLSSGSPNIVGLAVTTTVRFGGVEILFGHTQHIGARHRLQRLLILRQVVLRIAVIVQHHLPREQLGAGIVGEDQAVDRGIPCVPPLLLGDFALADAVDLFQDRLDRGNRGDALGAARDFEQAGLRVACVPRWQ